MSVARFKKYDEVLNTLVSEAISCTPESWTNGILSIDCDGTAINYSLKNSNEELKAQLSDKLRSLCEQLYVVMREQGDIWLEAIVEFAEKDENWNIDTKFKYEDSQQNISSAPIQKINKPWWKVW